MFDFSVRNRKEFLPYLDESFQEVLKLIQVWTSCVLIGRKEVEVKASIW